jgi:colanic acid/amylovoran biosynthesis glycosyltransferase
MLRERGVAHTDISNNGIRPTLHGLLAAIARPVLLLRSLHWIFRSNRSDARDLLASLLLLPRAFDILADLERRPPNVVHMYWGHYPALVGYLVQHRLPRVATSISIVAYDLNWEYGGAIEVVRRADVIRTHARANAAHIVRFTGVAADRINVIYNGVDVAWLKSIAARHHKVRHRLVVAGSLNPKKGIDDAITAFAYVRSTWPDATLVVVGDGNDRARLADLCRSLGVADGVEFLGHVPHARVIDEMSKAEVFMLLSRADGERLPNVVKEAMMCGCLCITTPTPGINELLADGVSGFIVPMRDAVGASEIVNQVFAGRVDKTKMISAGRQHIRLHFDLNRTAPRYEALWREALEGR